MFPNSQKVYQSALNQKISVSGTGFKQGMVFTFEPDLKVKIEYSRITSSVPVFVSLRIRRFSEILPVLI